MKYFHRFLTVLLLACVPAFHPSAANGNLILAEKGTARAVIVLGSGDPSAEWDRTLLTQTATVLADHLTKMTGGRFEIIKETDLGEVSVKKGHLTPATPTATRDVYLLLGEGALTKKCGVTTEGLAPGGIVLRTLDNAVVIMGRGDGTNPGGNGYAVFQFLEALGCRYLWPGELGKVIPSKPTLTVQKLDLRYSPPVGQRSIRNMTHGPRLFEQGIARLGMTADAYNSAFESAAQIRVPGNWDSWQCLGGSIGITGGHAGYGLKGGWEEYGKAHPEWFALQPDGTRDQSAGGARWRACVSNPGLIEEVVKTILAEADKNPQQRCFSLAPNDGGTINYCMCEECKKLDPPEAPKIPLRIFAKDGSVKAIEYPSLTDRHVHYWNAVAEKVSKVHPDILLSIDAYAEYATPPVREKLHPSLVVRYVPSDTADWKGWQAAGAKKIYWRPNNLHAGYREGALYQGAGGIVETARYLAANGMLATDVQGIYHNWATQGLNYYATARVFWNPKLTYPEILDDYCKAGFGAGAKFVKRYFLRAEELRSRYGAVPQGSPDQGNKLTPEAIAELKGYLKAAALAAQSDENARKRLVFLAAGLEYTAATAELYRLTLDNPQKNPEIMAKRWAAMRALDEKFPLAVNVAVVAGHDDMLIRAFGDPGQAAAPTSNPKVSEDGPDWLFEDQTRTKPKAL